jgi:hypothetical protein
MPRRAAWRLRLFRLPIALPGTLPKAVLQLAIKWIRNAAELGSVKSRANPAFARACGAFRQLLPQFLKEPRLVLNIRLAVKDQFEGRTADTMTQGTQSSVVNPPY